MNYFDYGAIALVVLWGIAGLLRGLTREISGLVVLVVCLLFSPHVAPLITDLLTNNTRLTETQVAGPIAIVLAVAALAIVTALFMSLISHIMDYGFIGKIDRMGGMLAGLLKAAAVISAVILISHAVTSDFLTRHVLEESILGRWGNQHLPALYNAAAERFEHMPKLGASGSAEAAAEATPSPAASE